VNRARHAYADVARRSGRALRLEDQPGKLLERRVVPARGVGARLRSISRPSLSNTAISIFVPS
jgi:hypothetical protein